MRVAALWFPDWPVQAARLDSGDELREPIAIAAQHRVKVCSHAARQMGIRRGMRVRNAQAVAPDLTVIDDNPDRDGRMFASLAASFDEVAASVEVVRPGLVVVDVEAAGRFHGTEDKALEMLIDAASRRGIDTQVGAADEIATALIAARASQVVPPGGSAAFLAAQSLGVLVAEEALAADVDTVRSLGQLGVSTLGELAKLPPSAVTTRFGAKGMRIHRIASAAPDRRVAPELPVEDLAVAITPEDPIERVDAAAFAARALAASLHERLKATGRNCLRLKVVAELGDGTRVERVWRTREPLTEAATADRVRWQLDGWLTSLRSAQEGRDGQGGQGGQGGAITSLILEPLEFAAPEPVGELWADGASTDTARRVVERVQSQLGIDAVLQPRLVGGRGVAERVQMVPFGEEPEDVDRQSWPGAILAPLPARLGGGIDHPASRIMLIDASGAPVIVTAEALLSSEPYGLAWGEKRYLVTGWAGPWPVDADWWTQTELPAGRVARMQVIGREGGEDGDATGWLLVWSRRSWRVEAVY
ncbi:Y-family DNA polymerase [Corynebacterium wankanglinii]|uniref:DNA polymerase Y family protein n=1 Tax=Corynebacterium wankanglinii TaxID=2735136 RepID=A0A838CIS8_9CORY|nr:DNA polymerase Y family protein [Corynebacterium wankanglinii]MBA1834469.1 DNA polymerase Y family protein [Corynebacterium wankanglinii]